MPANNHAHSTCTSQHNKSMHISGRGSEGNPPAWMVGAGFLHHADAVNDGTDGDAQRAAGTVRSHVGEVRLGVKGDSLVA